METFSFRGRTLLPFTIKIYNVYEKRPSMMQCIRGGLFYLLLAWLDSLALVTVIIHLYFIRILKWCQSGDHLNRLIIVVYYIMNFTRLNVNHLSFG